MSINNIFSYQSSLPQIAKTAFIAQTAMVIGDVIIGEDSSIWFQSVVRGDVNKIRIGERTNIQDGSIIHVDHKKYGTFIGSDVTVGHMALLHACTIEDESFIGMKACIMDGAVVETGAMVAAGALVSPGKVVKKGELWAGLPAKPIRKITPEEREYFLYSAQHYVRLSKNYLEE